MNKAIFTFLFLISMIDYLQSRNSIIEDLQNSLEESRGMIRIKGDSTIIALTGTSDSLFFLRKDQKTVESPRFHIQVYMSNNSYTGRSEASNKQMAIKNVFPGLPTYLIYRAPNWKLLVGNFINREEANSFIKQLQKRFPEFGKEMYVVKILLSAKENK